MKIFKVILVILVFGFMKNSFGVARGEEDGKLGAKFIHGLALVLPDVMPKKGTKRGRGESPAEEPREEFKQLDLKRCNSDPTESRAKKRRHPKKTLLQIINDWEHLSDKKRWLNQLDGLPHPHKKAIPDPREKI